MEKEEVNRGDITTIGITKSGLISIEFYDPDQMDGADYTTIFLNSDQAKMIAKLGEILIGKTA